jgi:glycosyltransferase involved in cell wall biosynthesis
LRVLCLTDFPVKPPDRWIWNHLEGLQDEVDFLWTQPQDRSARWGKIVTRYPAYYRLAMQALQITGRNPYDLIVAWESKVGIPLALLRRATRQSSIPFVILTFTPGETSSVVYPLIRLGLQTVSHISVLTRSEIATYQRLFDLPVSRVSVCWLGTYDQYPDLPSADGLEASRSLPYIHASGRSARDYLTMIRAVENLDVKVLIHGRGYNFAGLRIPPNVEIGELVPTARYAQLVRDSLLEVVPLRQTPFPVGSSQIVFTMMMGKAMVATHTDSTVDYIEHGVTGLLVKPGDENDMRTSIRYLLDHPKEAAQLGLNARRSFEERYTFEQFARRAYEILARVHAESIARA